jgi:uncharacterized membrane protein
MAEESKDKGTDRNTYMLFAATYATEEEAIADYEDVKDLYKQQDLIDTFDAAVISKDEKGKVHIRKWREEPTRHGATVGLVVGLAVGALVALFPSVAIGISMAVGGVAGAAVGATAEHVRRGLSREDLMELGETLDNGNSGLVVVAETDMQEKVDQAVSRGKDKVQKQIQVDADSLKDEIDKL